MARSSSGKRKAAAAVAPYPPAPRRLRSEKKALNIAAELGIIINIFSYAPYGRDKMNICLAVGRKDANMLRRGFLKDNMDFLQQTLSSVGSSLQPSRLNHARARIQAWILVNSDWRKHCLPPNDPKLPTMCTFVDTPQNSIPPLALFNNPALALEFDIPQVLHHLLDRIDINSLSWSGYITGPSKQHLLHLATLLRVTKYSMSYSCLLDLFRRLPPNVSFLRAMDDAKILIWQAWFHNDHCPGHDFAFFLQRSKFDPNREYFVPRKNGGEVADLPLLYAIRHVVKAFRKNEVESMRLRTFKTRILIELRADPWATTSNIEISPISHLTRERQIIANRHPSVERDRKLSFYSRLIDLMHYSQRL